ncbi:MAG: LamG-like jellyroll fold domain-containing protein, partial [Phycisphaeraceae bacterium]|nr:LamG-like jellyroll fold domain-containing protein [Phycisphaeraceae bacterium]
MIAYWPLDGNGVDAVKGLKGNPVGGKFVAGKFGRAYDMQGADQYFAVPQIDGKAQSFTMMMWVNVRSTPGRFSSFYHNDGWEKHDLHWFVTDGIISSHVNGTDITRSSHRMDQHFNRWVHLAVAYDGSKGKCKYFLNGKRVHEQDTGNQLNATLGPGRFFGWKGKQKRPMNGTLDEVRVYNRALMQREIAAAMNQRGVADPDLVGHWPFEGTLEGIPGDPKADASVLAGTGGDGFAEGRMGKALKTSLNEPLALPKVNLETDRLTITAWIKAEDPAALAGLVFNRNGSGATGLDLQYKQLRYTWNSDPKTYKSQTGLFVPADEWMFAAMRIEPDKATLFGWSKTYGFKTWSQKLAHKPARIDRLYFGFDEISQKGRPPRAFVGLIDEVRIYKRPLSDQEIDSLIQAGGGNLDQVDGRVVQTDQLQKLGTLRTDFWAEAPARDADGCRSKIMAEKTKPTRSGILNKFESKRRIGNHYAQRLSGYLYPPQTGQYKFQVKADDSGVLYLSADTEPANVRRISNGQAVKLQKNRIYYVEAWHRE